MPARRSASLWRSNTPKQYMLEMLAAHVELAQLIANWAALAHLYPAMLTTPQPRQGAVMVGGLSSVRATEEAVKIVCAGLENGAIKLLGASFNTKNPEEAGALDGKYLSKLLEELTGTLRRSSNG